MKGLLKSLMSPHQFLNFIFKDRFRITCSTGVFVHRENNKCSTFSFYVDIDRLIFLLLQYFLNTIAFFAKGEVFLKESMDFKMFKTR